MPNSPDMHEPRDGGFEPQREWILTNGLGGYAMGTIDGFLTRRYHGLLISAQPSGRIMMLNGVAERVRLPHGAVVYLGTQVLSGSGTHDIVGVSEFRLEMGLPIWVYRIQNFILEKRVILPYRQNTVHVSYRLLSGEGAVRLAVRPAIHIRNHDDPVSTPLTSKYVLTLMDGRCEVSAGAGLPALHLQFTAPRPALTYDPRLIQNILYSSEEERGYESVGEMWSPGYYRSDLIAGQQAALVASTDSWDAMLSMTTTQVLEAEQRRRENLLAIAKPEAQQGYGADLVLAADQFLMTPAGRVEDTARARAEGEEAWSVIAGYPWFTDWGRDTMISLEGLTLVTGRQKEARWILRTFANYVRDGLIPNLFPEGQREGLYHTADASLWFFHAVHRYVATTEDTETLWVIMPKLLEIADSHIRGTLFGIGIDPADGLLTQGQEGYQLTWMDAKVDDWVVTPRRGKAVEINGLWFNALCLLSEWLEEKEPGRAKTFRSQAEQVRSSFNKRFWCQEKGYLFDVIDGPAGNDAACRPNQLLAFSLTHPVLDRSMWEPVLDVVTERLLTPFGLRSLSPDDKNYKAQYFGDLRARDAAYHQGTVWAWLIGPFIDAWVKLHPEAAPAGRKFLNELASNVNEACGGTIGEIFDGNPPYTARGCNSQAWSVAECLRCWVKTANSAPG
ncbi:MAG TPA: amylo-alpha-1,6-glucosidase [Bryobacteraceae bacterium]|nr:amylo-alpha-1,6-glucosidase [Bryobacteraceae bacterium]